MHFDTFQHSGKIISGGCTKSYRAHGALLLRCIGIGCSRMPLVGCTPMDADMSGLLQRMLAKFDDTHLAACIAHSTFGLTPPPHEAAVAKCDFLNQNTQSMHFDTFQHSGKIISDGCTNPIRCTELYRSDALGSDAVECLLVGCTQMDADMSGLLQRMLAKLDDTHLAACIAHSTFGLTPPPHEAAIAKCDFLNPNTQSMHFDTFQHSGKIISGGCTKSYRVHGALLRRCVGIGCSRMPLVGCTQMDADMSGLLQRMLAKLDDTHLAACIAHSTFWSYPASTRGSNR